ncbi:carbohydrate ABC transporter permease [Alloscardovia macacae]|uniref:Binding-protein-dependent transport systems inner membrane component n=1 Tax=Alloscardovia macacae TaxID=1160091 RepID=A0A261F5E8_9BIFI|nr:sugar ABC transporter permease [Alloscardovia macacae]OZG54340.1 binding-protein-dependent transport systems inner membrane component [Alloscardovia macacae]
MATMHTDHGGATHPSGHVYAYTRTHKTDLERKRARFGFFCALPTGLLILIFILIPTFNIFRMSVYKWSGYSDDQIFVGFENFRKLFDDMNFVHAFQNTVLLLVVVTSVTLPLAVIFAAILMQNRIIGGSLIRFILYIPSVLSIVIVAAIFSAIYDQNNGLINGSLQFLHLEGLRQVWLGNQKIVIYAIAFSMLWQSVGYYMVMYMASMAGIDPSLYEASQIDGASKTRQLFSLTIPLMWQNIRTTLTFFIISSVNLSFVLVTALTNGGPDNASQVLLGYMYQQAYTNSSYGYGMAIGVVIFLYSFIMSLVVSRATKRDVVEF